MSSEIIQNKTKQNKQQQKKKNKQKHKKQSDKNNNEKKNTRTFTSWAHPLNLKVMDGLGLNKTMYHY